MAASTTATPDSDTAPSLPGPPKKRRGKPFIPSGSVDLTQMRHHLEELTANEQARTQLAADLAGYAERVAAALMGDAEPPHANDLAHAFWSLHLSLVEQRLAMRTQYLVVADLLQQILARLPK